MFKIEILAVSRLKKGALFDLVSDYKTRIQWPLTIHEIETKTSDAQKSKAEESEKIQKLINPQAYIIVMDERGKSLRSLDFAKTLEQQKDNGSGLVQFIIGGADGLTDSVRDKAHKIMSFGTQTWPHMLARVMLLEQIYRAQQIISGHPYHRES